MRSTAVAVCLCATALACGRVRYEQRACPADMLTIDDDGGPTAYCIERVERTDPQEQHEAEKVCWDAGRRLCTEAEWVRACQDLGGSMTDANDDYEWTSDKLAPMYDTAYRVGMATCSAQETQPILGLPGAYRCCLGR